MFADETHKQFLYHRSIKPDNEKAWRGNCGYFMGKMEALHVDHSTTYIDEHQRTTMLVRSRLRTAPRKGTCSLHVHSKHEKWVVHTMSLSVHTLHACNRSERAIQKEI